MRIEYQTCYLFGYYAERSNPRSELESWFRKLGKKIIPGRVKRRTKNEPRLAVPSCHGR